MRARALCAALVWAAALVGGEHPAGAVSDSEFSAKVRAIEVDPNETLFETHYITSNERHHNATLENLHAPGGVYIGIGTDQNFELIPHLNPTHVIMVDFDQWVVDAHALYAHLFRTRETPRAFINFFQERDIAKKRRELRSIASTPELAQSLERIFMRYRADILKRLKAIRTLSAGRADESYLSNQASYDTLRRLVHSGRYIALRGDLTGTKSLRGLAKVLKDLDLKVGTIALSNAEQYFDYGQDFKANMRAFDYKADALILRTFRVKGRHYDYYLQSMSAFLEWLETPKVSRFKALIASRLETPHPRVFLLPGKSQCTTGLCVPREECGEITFQGCCSGHTLRWCAAGGLYTLSCGDTPAGRCGWSSGDRRFTCGGESDAPTPFEMTCP